MAQNLENKRLREVDMISNLPIELIHEILSRLSTEEAARTCVLSKTWNGIWQTMPVFDFNLNHGDLYYIRQGTQEQQLEFLRKYIKFMDFVDHTIRSCQEHDNKVNKFGLETINLYSERRFPQMDRWLEFVCSTGALHSLKLVLECVVHPQPRYQLPSTIAASANSLVELTLTGHIRMDHQAAPFNNHVLFTALKRLSLTFVYANDEVVSSVCSSCPALRRLAFEFCLGLKHIKVEGLTMLKALVIHDGDSTGLETIHVDVPSLEKLSYGSLYMRRCEINIETCTRLRAFTIGGVDAVGIGRLLLVTEPVILLMVDAQPELKSQMLKNVTRSRIVYIPGNQLKNLIIVLRECLLVARMDIPNTAPEDMYGARLLVLKIPNPRELEAELEF